MKKELGVLQEFRGLLYGVEVTVTFSKSELPLFFQMGGVHLP
jgi:hypothetical protein